MGQYRLFLNKSTFMFDVWLSNGGSIDVLIPNSFNLFAQYKQIDLVSCIKHGTTAIFVPIEIEYGHDIEFLVLKKYIVGD